MEQEDFESEYASEINDVRILSDFKGITFSNFKLTEVKKQLLLACIDGKIEPSLFWSAEILCSGHFHHLWDCIFFFYSKYIHFANPKLAVYLEMRLESFTSILRQGYKENELQLRNNSRVRQLFAEIICILCCAKRKQPYESIKITRDDFEMARVNEKLRAPNVDYGNDVFKVGGDPNELFVAVNEFCFHISKESKNIRFAYFWFEFILEFETLCKKKTNEFPVQLKGERRVSIPVESKYQMDIIWMIWEGIEKEAATLNSRFFQRTIRALLHLFCFQYVTGCVKKRKFLIYFAISLLCENTVVLIEAAKEEIIREEEKMQISSILSNLNMVYKQIKENEESPCTEYLFQNLKHMNLKKTIEKLEAIDSFDESFLPRTID